MSLSGFRLAFAVLVAGVLALSSANIGRWMSIGKKSFLGIRTMDSSSTTADALAARALSAEGRSLLFSNARTKQFFLEKPVPQEKLKEIFDLVKFGPTSVNCCPIRIVFVTSEAAKAKLYPTLMDLNVPKVKTAPVTAILAWDTEYFEQLPRLLPAMAAYKDVLKSSPDRGAWNGEQSATLEAAYFILAARSVGLDAGPMNGFNRSAVDAAFFGPHEGARKHWKSFMIVNLGYGDDTKVYPRAPRFDFDDVCVVE